MLRSVVLLHTLADGSSHHDWLIERAPADAPLLTFRTGSRPDGARGFEAERLPDHRRRYLDYEGPLDGGRGHVRRIAAGLVLRLVETEAAVDVSVDWGAGVPVRYRVAQRDGDAWSVVVERGTV